MLTYDMPTEDACLTDRQSQLESIRSRLVTSHPRSLSQAEISKSQAFKELRATLE